MSKISRRDFLKLTGGMGGAALSYYYGLLKQPNFPAPHPTYPPYISGPLRWPIFRPPYLQEDAQMAGFLFKAGEKELTALCNQYLNLNPDQTFTYLPASNHVLLILADMWNSSLDPEDQLKGRIHENEVGFWIPLIALRKKAGIYLPDHLAWFVPYLFVNNDSALTNGRELYGFNKSFAKIEHAPDIWKPTWAVHITGFKKFAPNAAATIEPLLSLSCTDCPTIISEPPIAITKEKLTEKIATSLPPDSENKETIKLISSFLANNAPFVFLKQFPDLKNPNEACYQAIAETAVTIKQFKTGDTLSGYQLTLNHLDSHPIAKTLGLSLNPEKKNPVWAFWLKLDFILEKGVEIWKS